jgi:hypothetical protein
MPEDAEFLRKEAEQLLEAAKKAARPELRAALRLSR